MDLSNKFKELKSLVYQYRDEKEKEAVALIETQKILKKKLKKIKRVMKK